MRILALLVSLSLAACSPKKDAEEPDTSWDTSTDPDPAPSDPDPEPAGDDDDDEPKPKPKRITQDDDFEINHQDCDALAGAYGRAWENDEMKKLNERKLEKKALDKAATEVKKGGQDMKANRRDECYNTVGTAYLRSRLKCTMKAKSLERFNNCMDGLAE